MAHGIDTDMLAASIISAAANLPTGNNGTVTFEEFCAVFPQFDLPNTSTIQISEDIFAMYSDMAHGCISEGRWNSKWKYAVCLYIAHFLTLWLQTQNGAAGTAASVISTAQTVFAKASKSVGDVSVSFDTSSISGSLPGWGMWATTTYGTQLAQMARFLPTAQAGMMVW